MNFLKKLILGIKNWFSPSVAEMEKDFRNAFGENACFYCAVERFHYREFGRDWPAPPHQCREQFKSYR